MKKLFLFFLFIFSIHVFSQGWNNTVTTSISDPNFLGMDLFSNKNGNNLAQLSWNGDFSQIYYVKYYLLNSSGSVIRSSTIDTRGPYNGSIEHINISGNNDKVYVVYKTGGIIRAKISTDAGVSWNNYDLNPAGSDVFNGVDIAFDNNANKLHMVYNRGDGQTYYYVLNSSNAWGDFKQVSDYGDASTPTVSFSQSRVHISYHESGISKSRDKYLTNWQTPQTISSSSFIERIQAGSSNLLYFDAEPQPGLYANLYVRQRTLNGSSWSFPTLLHERTEFNAPFVSAANTTDGKTHIVYSGLGSTVYRNYSGSTWSSELTIGDNYENPVISSVSNDLFVVWMGTPNNNNFIKYRQYDAAPLSPANVQANFITSNQVTTTWNPNNEPDLVGYNIYRQIYYGSTTLEEVKINSSLLTNTSFTDNFIIPSGFPSGVDLYLRYKIEAVDIQNNISSKTNTNSLYLGRTLSGSISGDKTVSMNHVFFGNITSTGNITVNNNSVLRVQPNTTVGFYGYRTFTVTSGSKIYAIGTSSQLIKFKSATTSSPGSWNYLTIQGDGSILKYCTFDAGTHGLYLYNAGGPAVIENCTFKYNSQNGIRVYNSSTKIKSSFIHNNIGVGIHCNNYSDVDLIGNKIYSNGSGGISTYFYDNIELFGNVIEYNSGYGLNTAYGDIVRVGKVYGWWGYNTIRFNSNSEIYSNGSYNPNLLEISGASIHDNSGLEIENQSSSYTINAQSGYWDANCCQYLGPVNLMPTIYCSLPTWDGDERTDGSPIGKAAVYIMEGEIEWFLDPAISDQEKVQKCKDIISSSTKKLKKCKML